MDSLQKLEKMQCSFCQLSIDEKFGYLRSNVRSRVRNLFVICDKNPELSIDTVLADGDRTSLLDVLENHMKHILKVKCIRNYGPAFELKDIEPHLSRLNCLQLNGLTLDAAQVKILTGYCRQLYELVLRVNNKVGCQYLQCLFQGNRMLKHVTLINHYCANKGICMLGLPVLITSLELIGCCLRTIHFGECIVRMKSLKKIRLEKCFRLPADILLLILRERPALEVFQYNLYNRFPTRIVQTYKFESNLSSLSLINNKQVDDDLLIVICEHCPNLKYLLVGYLPFTTFNLIGFGTFVENCTITLTDKSISKLQRLKKLRTLGLFSLYSLEEGNSFLNGVLFCRSLQNLCFSTNNRDITDIACGAIKKLREVNRLAVLGYIFMEKHIRAIYNTLKEDTARAKIYGSRPLLTLTIEEYSFDQETVNAYRLHNYTIDQTNMIAFIRSLQKEYL